MNKIAFITRFHFPKDHPDFNWRFDYYKKEVLPRILNQTIQNFDICIWCEDWHIDLFKALSPKIKTFKATYKKRESRYFIDYTPWENVTGLDKYNLQIGLDSDDLIEPNFIENILPLCIGDNTIQFSVQPIKLDIKTGNKYRMRIYNEKEGSPIFAFYQPKPDDDFKFAYHTSHLRMPLIANKTILIPEGLAYMSIHDLNDSTGIKKTDIKL
jgi:hypothetical protein